MTHITVSGGSIGQSVHLVIQDDLDGQLVRIVTPSGRVWDSGSFQAIAECREVIAALDWIIRNVERVGYPLGPRPDPPKTEEEGGTVIL